MRWWPSLAWMGLIFWLSSQPDLPHAPGPWLELLFKKGAHAFVYGMLAWLYLRALRAESGRRARWVSVGLALVYALTDEYHQTFVPGRNGNLFDVAVDGTGAALAMWLDVRWRRFRRWRCFGCVR